MDPKNVARVLGKIGSERGRANEHHVLEACLLASRPAWMVSARAGTRAEDHDGIDVVVESDVGKLYVQVKSSRTGKAAFVKRRPRVSPITAPRIRVTSRCDHVEARPPSPRGRDQIAA
jgi:hypothetical protein